LRRGIGATFTVEAGGRWSATIGGTRAAPNEGTGTDDGANAGTGRGDIDGTEPGRSAELASALSGERGPGSADVASLSDSGSEKVAVVAGIGTGAVSVPTGEADPLSSEIGSPEAAGERALVADILSTLLDPIADIVPELAELAGERTPEKLPALAEDIDGIRTGGCVDGIGTGADGSSGAVALSDDFRFGPVLTGEYCVMSSFPSLMASAMNSGVRHQSLGFESSSLTRFVTKIRRR
jgi:hypothetical protein